MFELRTIRNTSRGFALVCAGLLAFLMARTCLPGVSRTASHVSTLRSHLPHDHRPYLDHFTPDCIIPVARVFLPDPLIHATSLLPLASDPFIQAFAFGVQYNRPPPII